MLQSILLALRKKEKPQPKLYPEASDRVPEGVYNRWKSAYIPKMNSYSAMGDTIEYFIVTGLESSRTHIVRVLRDTKDPHQYLAQYAEDSRIFHRPVTTVTASDIMNAYLLSRFEQENSNPEDRFGLRRVGTIDDFVEQMRSGHRP